MKGLFKRHRPQAQRLLTRCSVAPRRQTRKELILRSVRRTPNGLEPLAAKVPEITAMFWVLKILTTGMGEALSDFMGQTNIPVAAVIGVFGVIFAVRLQLNAREYRAPVYWFAVMMVAVFGTMAADAIHDGAGLSYAVTTPAFAILVAVVFYGWWRSEGTLSIHSIITRRREAFYWTAVLATFALGTAAGDLTALSLNWGFFPSAALFAGLIAIPALLWWRGKLNPIVAFWTAYVITRPLGASFADGFSKPQSGFGLGDGPVGGVALVIFIMLVTYTAVAKRDIQAPQHHSPSSRPSRTGVLQSEPQPAES